MAVANKIIALLDTMTLASLDSLPPVRRRQFADLCRHWADVAGSPRGAPAAKLRASVSVDAPAGSPRGEVAVESLSAKSPGREI
jgi:hypothetical protein